MPLLALRSVSKVYQADGGPVAALQDVSFEVNAGDFIALVGRSGCGKSTLLNLCGTMDFPSAGEVLLEGRSTSGLNDAALTQLRREKIGFIFQSFQLMHTLTAVENVELPLLLARKRNVRAAALERLRWVEMEEYAQRLPHQLSGGEQQRVSIARALVHNSTLILADEPTGNLDTVSGEIVLKLLVRAARELNVAVIMATHSAESAALADRIIYLRDGRMEAPYAPLKFVSLR
ncbi:MAG: ABC transporter ATP-binding protein [Acidobacteriaceae bacterium]|nr:ABC transporter ATP-binding protein [Acidobacteriaceae bacterium]